MVDRVGRVDYKYGQCDGHWRLAFMVRLRLVLWCVMVSCGRWVCCWEVGVCMVLDVFDVRWAFVSALFFWRSCGWKIDAGDWRRWTFAAPRRCAESVCLSVSEAAEWVGSRCASAGLRSFVSGSGRRRLHWQCISPAQASSARLGASLASQWLSASDKNDKTPCSNLCM